MFALSETEDPVWIVHACGDPGERSELFLPLPIVVSASETPSRRKNAGAYSGFCWPQFGDPSNTPAPALPVNQSVARVTELRPAEPEQHSGSAGAGVLL